MAARSGPETEGQPGLPHTQMEKKGQPRTGSSTTNRATTGDRGGDDGGRAWLADKRREGRPFFVRRGPPFPLSFNPFFPRRLSLSYLCLLP